MERSGLGSKSCTNMQEIILLSTCSEGVSIVKGLHVSYAWPLCRTAAHVHGLEGSWMHFMASEGWPVGNQCKVYSREESMETKQAPGRATRMYLPRRDCLSMMSQWPLGGTCCAPTVSIALTQWKLGSPGSSNSISFNCIMRKEGSENHPKIWLKFELDTSSYETNQFWSALLIFFSELRPVPL